MLLEVLLAEGGSGWEDSWSNQCTVPGEPTLLLAAKQGRVAAVVAALASGEAVDFAGPDRCTALIWAARWGHLGCVRALLEAGASVAHRGWGGQTALMVAAVNRQTECVRALLAHPHLRLCKAKQDAATALRRMLNTTPWWRGALVMRTIACAKAILHWELRGAVFPRLRNQVRLRAYEAELMAKAWHPNGPLFGYYMHVDDAI